jgi:glutaminyl-peptide cyclotransferase
MGQAMRFLVAVLVVQVVVIAAFATLAATDNLPFVDGDGSGSAGAADGTPRATVDRFDSRAAWRLLREQVALGPRPAGSAASRRLARRLRRLLPRDRYQAVPGGLRNVVGSVPGRDPRRYVVVGAHYDTKDLPGFVGANDSASGTATVVQLALTLRPRRLRPTVVFVLFDGEESPAGTPDSQFEEKGLRGSKIAAVRFAGASSMVLLDFVGEKGLRLPREQLSDGRLWARLRRAALRVGVGPVFPPTTDGAILDDHVPFLRRRVPSIDLIDFDFACFHQRCDNLSAVSERSLDAVGEAVYELLARL